MQPPTRTLDVLSGTKSFEGLLLPPHILQALHEAGFRRPSPVQEAALPLARMGTDLIVQAKAGTGKTLVFAVAAVERVDLANSSPQVLVLAPTREIALQASETVALAAAALPLPGLACASFIGGLPVDEDEKQLRRACHVAVGTTGRMLSLIQRGTLRTDSVHLLVLDEADKLLADSFRKDTLAIASALPQRRQLLALSATYAPSALEQLRRLMGGRQQEVLLSSEDTSLLGVHQCYRMLPGSGGGGGGGHTASRTPAPQRRRQQQQQQQQEQQEQEQQPHSSAEWLEARLAALLQLLSAVSYQQAVVFCKYRADAEVVAERLLAGGFPAAYLSAQRTQLQRIEALNALRDFRLRVAVTTDLAARGVDLDRVNLVVNLALPPDAETYMHRVGRAGRFGTRGVAVTLLDGPEELRRLEGYLAEVAGGQVTELPEFVPEEWYRQAQQPASGTSSLGGGSDGGSLGAMGPRTPASSSLLASAGAESWGSGGDGALADIATASLWGDDGAEAGPLDLEQQQGQQQQQESVAQQHDKQWQQQEEEEEAGQQEEQWGFEGLDLSYTVVPKAAAGRAPAAAGPAASPTPSKPAVSSLTAAVAAAAASSRRRAAAAAAAANGSGTGSPADSCSSADSVDSWGSTSDDDYSGSDGEESAAAAAAAAAACSGGGSGGSGSGGATPPPVSFKPLRRVGSAGSTASSGSSGSSGGRLSSPPAPIPGRHHHSTLQQEVQRPLWANSYEDASPGLAAVVEEAPPALLAGDATDAGADAACVAGPGGAFPGTGMTSSDEEPSFKDSWLNEEQKESAAAEKAARRQHRRAAAAAEAAPPGFELRPHGRGPRSGTAAAGSRRAQQAQQAQQGHYWAIVRSVQQDVQSRQGGGGGGGVAPAAAAGAAGEEEGGGEVFETVVPRRRRPLGSAQASATRRREEAAAAAAAAEEAQAAALERVAERQEEEAACGAAAAVVAADAAAEAEEQQRQWTAFWHQHYAYYGCYPSEGLFSAGGDSTESTAAAPAAGGSPLPAGASAELLPPPPPPPAPPPQLSAAVWASEPPPHDQRSGDSAAPAAAAGGAAGGDAAGGGEGGWVTVPATLLARYQQLEWEQWHRQYGEWQTLWEQYKSYWAGLYLQQQEHQQQQESQQQSEHQQH